MIHFLFFFSKLQLPHYTESIPPCAVHKIASNHKHYIVIPDHSTSEFSSPQCFPCVNRVPPPLRFPLTKKHLFVTSLPSTFFHRLLLFHTPYISQMLVPANLPPLTVHFFSSSRIFFAPLCVESSRHALVSPQPDIVFNLNVVADNNTVHNSAADICFSA